MARQFDVFRTVQGMLVVVIQSDLLEATRTGVVAPMLPVGRGGSAMRSLNPVLAIGDETVAVTPQLLATLTTPSWVIASDRSRTGGMKSRAASTPFSRVSEGGATA